MRDIAMWAMIGGILAVGPLLVFVGLRQSFSRRPVEERYRASRGGGLVGVFDAVWSPSAHEAGAERDRQSKRTAPAPTPGDPPWQISDDHRITLDL